MEGEDGDMRGIPGTYGSKLYHLVKFVKLGHLFFVDQTRKYKSSVFKCNFFGTPFIALTDFKGVTALFDPNKVEKEEGFGSFRFNKDLLDGHVPSMFSNDSQHVRKKEFLIKIAKSMKMQTLMPNILDIMPEHLIKWHFREGKGMSSQEEWEDRILLLASDIMSETLLGIRLDGDAFLNWRFSVLKPTKKTCGRPSKKSQTAMDSLEHLKAAVENSPNIDEIYEAAEKFGISHEEAVLEILWMLNFNASPGTGAAMRSAAARLSLMSKEKKNEMKEEIKMHLGTVGLNLRTLKKMNKLDQFTCEVLRMHPPVALFFGVARRDFVVETKTGNYRIRRGQRLLGNCHLAQRDPEVFETPGAKCVDTFDPDRFSLNETLKPNLLCTHGRMNQKPSGMDHNCAGAHVGIITLKTFILYLILFCDWELEEKPYWTRTNLIRYGNPDEPIRLKSFKYTRDKEELLLPDQPDSSSDDELPDLRPQIPQNMEEDDE
ncbi:9-divinyl ether synthase [Nematostella vectensis]|uniref:9-divinyl ether synthase n=1 Tax=Nematostella vectensis TaxID=45351 RepID=UPI002076D89C|nr:9-divinyl ether synthase [Nematostella vectensis]